MGIHLRLDPDEPGFIIGGIHCRLLHRPSGRSGSYTGLIGFNPRRLQGPKRKMSSHATDLSVYAKSSSSFFLQIAVQKVTQKLN